MKKKNNIIIFQRFLPHYRIPVFIEISKKIRNIIICIGRSRTKEKSFLESKEGLSILEIRDFYLFPKKDNLVFLDIVNPIIKLKPKIIVLEFSLSILSNYLLFFLRPIFCYKLILWSHGYNIRKGFRPLKSFTDRLRVWCMNKADAIILYGKMGNRVISPYIKKPEKIFVAQNTLDTNILLRIRNKLDKIGKKKIKEEIGFNKKYNLIYIGRLLSRKEPDRLISVFKIILNFIDDVELHFVGDGVIKRKLQILSKGLEVKFWGYIKDDEMVGKMLYSSDLMVMPGFLGLSVVSALCFDCPVVTQMQGTEGPFHSPEVEYVVDGKTGFFSEYGNDEKMARIIIDYMKDKGKQEKMKKWIRHMVRDCCSIKNMVVGFEKAINYVNK